MKKNPLISVCLPTFNSEKVIRPTLESIKKQTYKNYELVVSDDFSQDQTVDLIRSFHFQKLVIKRNKKNLGYGKNMQRLEKMPKGEIIFLVAHDDIIIPEALELTVKAFLADPKVGVVTRPYYWFDTNPLIPIRRIPPIDPKGTVVVDILNTPEMIIPVIESVGQLSGLAYRRDLFTHFHHEVFPAHIYPFMDILKVAKCAFLSKYTVAVGTMASQTRSKPKIYETSPTLSWMNMFETVFSQEKYKKVREIAKEHMAQNYLGLIQLKNYGSSVSVLYREIAILIRIRPKNILSFPFWFFAIGTAITPRPVLRYLVDKYKATFFRLQS